MDEALGHEVRKLLGDCWHHLERSVIAVRSRVVALEEVAHKPPVPRDGFTPGVIHHINVMLESWVGSRRPLVPEFFKISAGIF